MSSSSCRWFWRAVALGALLAAGCSARGAPVAPQCPATLAVDQKVEALAGWEVVIDAKSFPLDRVALYSGHPSEKATLVPDESSPRAGGSIDRWTFTRSPNESIWLACVYSGTGAILAQRLGDSIKGCAVDYETTPSGTRQRVVSVSCQ